MTLRGIDVSSWQAGIDPAAVDADFVIVKATGGTLYTNPDYRRQADAALAAGKLLGVYHFAQEAGCKGDAASEAAHFLNAFAPYRSRAIPILDWEADATSQPVEWAASWLRAVQRDTKARPWFYSYSNYVNSTDCSKLAEWPLWIAAYYAGYEQMGWQANPPLMGGTGAWSHAACYQYTSSGRISGYDGNLDLNIFYGDREDWAAMCGGKRAGVPIDLGDEVAQVHRFMSEDPRFGYSWDERWGNPAETIVFTSTSGRKYELHPGDYDCSSSVITAWKLVLKGTPYEGCLDGTVSTHSMRDVFRRSGLFEVWDTASTVAQKGDLYLNDSSHVAMCQPPGTYSGRHYADPLSEFSSNEYGGAHGGKRGDQTGWESHITEFYEYPWNCTMHYNGKADFYIEDEEKEEEDMPYAFLFQPDEQGYMCFYDGHAVTKLSHPDQMKAIQDTYKKVTGKDIPCFKLGTKSAPWAGRFMQAVEVRDAEAKIGYKGVS